MSKSTRTPTEVHNLTEAAALAAEVFDAIEQTPTPELEGVWRDLGGAIHLLGSAAGALKVMAKDGLRLLPPRGESSWCRCGHEHNTRPNERAVYACHWNFCECDGFRERPAPSEEERAELFRKLELDVDGWRNRARASGA